MYLSRSLVFLFFLALPAFAQSDRGSVTGTITDPAGAYIGNASVEVQNVDTGTLFEGGSSSTGNYGVQLPTGNYQMTVTVAGFKRYIRNSIFVPVAQTLRIDVRLEVGNVTDSITVTDNASLLRTESSEVSHNITADRIDDLPALQIGTGSGLRSPFGATNLIPGSSYSPDSSIRINGMPSNTQSLRIEGQDAQSGLSSGTQSWTQPSVDAIQEISIQTSNYAAEFGEAGGGVFNTTMRSGTNQFHGSAYDYLANEALNAGTPNTDAGSNNSQKAGQHIRNRIRRNDYGFTFGGPVRIPHLYNGHDKTFFFFNFEQYRETTVTYGGTAAGIKTVPTAAYRQGDFSAALGNVAVGKDQLGTTQFSSQIFDPCSDRMVNGVRVRTPFSGNKIPLGASCLGSSYMDPVSLKIQALMPLPTNANLFQNYYVSYANPRSQTAPSAKIDESLSPRAKLSGYWGLNSVQNANADGMPFPISAATGIDAVSNTARINLDYTLRPTMLLHFGIGLLNTNYSQRVGALGTQYDVQDYFGLKGTGTTQIFPAIGIVSGGIIGNLSTGQFGGYGQAMGAPAQAKISNYKPTANISLTWVKGNHSYKFGGELVVDGYINTSNTYAAPWIGFSAAATQTPTDQSQSFIGGTPGFVYASFLLGGSDSGVTSVPNKTRLGKHALAGFIQDTWKVTSRLTLDYGLRYDFQTYLKEHDGYQGELGAHTPNPIAGGLPGGIIFEGYGGGRCNCEFAHNYPWAFGPRAGLAFQVTPKTVLRAGAGISFTRTSADNFQSTSVASSTPYSSAQYGDASYYLRNGLNIPVTFPNFDPGQLPYAGIPTGIQNYFDRNAGRPARIVQWSIFLQREIGKDLVAEAGYVGNRGAWFQSTSAINDSALQPATLAALGLDIHNAADRAVLQSQLNQPAAVQRGFSYRPYALFPVTQTVKQALLPFPEFTSIIHQWAPLGTTWYDALQASVNKRYSHGLDISANFTWSKQLENGVESEGPFGFGSVNDVFNRDQNKYLSSSDQPFLLVVSGTYITPKWNVNKIVSHVVRDWQVGAVLRYASGIPINTPSSINQLTALLNRATFYNRVAGQPVFLQDLNCKCFDPSQTLVLNTAAWQDPGAGNWGTAAARYNDYRNARRPNESLNFGRNFRIGEGGKKNLQLRAEFNNVFNHWTWSSPTGAPSSPVTRSTTGALTGGYGFVNLNGGAGAVPRAGTLVARFTF